MLSPVIPTDASPSRCLQHSCEQALVQVAGGGGDQKTAGGGILLVYSLIYKQNSVAETMSWKNLDWSVQEYDPSGFRQYGVEGTL